ncbi:MAG TPA: DUF3526 domain-containing protein [Fimbriimonadaceae bacterium]|nr:DUF3526 domain-containing protein [Fimbriimonadaceae bacterium]HRJ33074.1 DUF3526 domain-containing protein [Fimbriimonadaceae bacterium]
MKAIFKREFISLVADGRFWIACCLFTLLVGLSTAISLKNDRAMEHLRGGAQHDLRHEWVSQTAKDPHSAAHFGTYQVKPGTSLSWFDPGLDPFLGTVNFLEAHVRSEFMLRPARDSTSARHLGYLSPAFLLQVIAPLLIILFCFGSFASDRESGTLRLTLASGVHPAALVGGKIVGGLAAVFALVLPSLGVSGIMMMRVSEEIDLARLGLLLLGYGFYFAAIASITLWVSSRVLKSQSALAIMISFWIGMTFVVPRTISDMAAAQHPLPSKAAFAQKIAEETRQGIDGHDPQDARREELLERTLREYGVQRIEELPVNFDAIALQASEDYTSELYQREFDRVADQLEAQAQIVRTTAVLAPFLAIRNWSMAVSESDWAHHRRYAQAVEKYRQELVRRLNTDMIQNSRTGDFGYVVQQDFWESIPPMTYEGPSVRASIEDVESQLGLLAAWALLGIVGCLRASARLRP